MARRKETIKLVEQEDDCGCVVACIAMVLGRTYQSVRADWGNDFTTEGVDLEQMMNYLGDHGCSIVYKAMRYYRHKDFAREAMLTPFAPIHIVRVLPNCDSKTGHVVVMDAEGKIYCPGGFSDEEIRRAYAVTEVCGIYK